MRIGFIDTWPVRGPVIIRGQGAMGIPLLQIIEQKTSRDKRERVGDLIH